MTQPQPSIRRHLMVWVLGALCLGALVLAFAAYALTLNEIDETMDDSLLQTALLLADRDLAGALANGPADRQLVASSDTESKLVAIARRLDGALLFTSEPAMALRFEPRPGHSLQTANDARWHVFSVLQNSRVVQVAQPVSVRQQLAAESASQLLVPLLLLVAMIGAMLVFALRRGLKPLTVVTDALAERSANSLAPLDVRAVPIELLPMVRTLNDLLVRLASAFEAQRHFVADAAHELRSPVTALQLQVQVLERSREPAEQALATAELSAGIGRARRLIEQLLTLSRAATDERGEVFARVPVRLDDLARRVVARWSAAAERKHIDLGAEAPAPVIVDGNADQLETLLGNLVENALRYAPERGIVDVIATVLDGAPSLRVIDTGPGIAAGERARVFDRFYRSARAVASGEAGSGLGLAIVQAIAERHGAVVSLHDGRDGAGLEVRTVFAPAR